MRVYIGPHPRNPDQQERKVEVEIDNYDLWNLDYTLSKIIHPALVRLRNETGSYPHVYEEDAPSYEDLPDEYKGASRRLSDPDHSRWMYVLDQMIFSFECSRDDDKWEEDLFSHDATWDEYEEVHNRIENGFLLFGKYFWALWL